jgi:peptidoglycan/LPS O-acetylase OafA/YrhL
MQTMKYRPDVDGLRAIAVLAVILNHLGIPGFGGGFIGVDIFFVISGYLITQLLLEEVDSTNDISLIHFYARRFRRLLPALLTVILFSLVVWIFFFSGVERETIRFIESVRWSIFGFANLYFKNNTGGYFDSPTAEMPMMHLWSLGVEEQFYLIWPIFLLILKKYLRFEQFLKIIIGLLIVGALIFSEYLLKTNHLNAAFYWMPARAWELGLGALATQITLKRDMKLSLLGLILIAASILIITPSNSFPGLIALPATFGTFLILLGNRNSSYVNKILGIKTLVQIGLLSYGLYLWHWPILVFTKMWLLNNDNLLTTSFFIIFMSFLLSYLTQIFVENPIRHQTFLKQSRQAWTVFLGITASLLMMLLATWVSKNDQNFTTADDVVKKINSRSPLEPYCMNNFDYLGAEKCTVRHDQNSKNSPSILVWGDSHSTALFPMFMEFVKNNKANAIQYSWSGTPPLIEVKDYYQENAKTTDETNLFNSKVIEDLKNKVALNQKIQHSAVIIAHWVQYTGKTYVSTRHGLTFIDHQRSHKGSLIVLKNGLRNSIKKLKQIGITKVMLVLPYPEFKYAAIRCYRRGIDQCTIPLVEIDSGRKEVSTVLTELSKEFDQVRTFDPVNYLCNNSNCTLMVDGNPIVYDDHHPSVSAAEMLGNKAAAELQWLIAK